MLNFRGVLFAIQKPQGNLLMREILTTDWAISNTASGMNYQLVHDLSINSSFTIEFVSSFSVLHRVKCIEHVGVLGALGSASNRFMRLRSSDSEESFPPTSRSTVANRELDLIRWPSIHKEVINHEALTLPISPIGHCNLTATGHEVKQKHCDVVTFGSFCWIEND